MVRGAGPSERWKTRRAIDVATFNPMAKPTSRLHGRPPITAAAGARTQIARNAGCLTRKCRKPMLALRLLTEGAPVALTTTMATVGLLGHDEAMEQEVDR
jgi:hypothetical protein